MARDKAKRPKVAVPPGGWQARKSPTPPEVPASNKRVPDVAWIDGEFNGQQLVWRFSEIDIKWDLLDNTLDNRAVLMMIDKLKAFESMKMGELFSPGSKVATKYDVPSVPQHTKDRLVEIARDDEDEIVRLRFNGPGRLYGVMRKHVFHVLWWDPHHRVWPSKKKGT